jgi:hypothetical protein
VPTSVTTARSRHTALSRFHEFICVNADAAELTVAVIGMD